MPRSAGPTPSADHKHLADRYRKATIELLTAARMIRDTAEALSSTKVKVSPPSLADLAEAVSILDTAAADLAEARAILAKTPAAKAGPLRHQT